MASRKQTRWRVNSSSRDTRERVKLREEEEAFDGSFDAHFVFFSFKYLNLENSPLGEERKMIYK